MRKRRRRSGQHSAAAGDFIRAMTEQGFYRLSSTLEVQEVAEAYRAAIADPERSNTVMSLRAQQAGLGSYCRAVDAVQLPELHLLVTSEIRALVAAFYGGEPKVLLACARRTEHIPPDIAREYDIYSNSWHCDNEPSDRFKMFVALSDIDEASGPLHLLSRPRTRAILGKGFKSRDDYAIAVEEIEDPADLELFTGGVGSVMFANVTQCLHRAGVPSCGHCRDIAEIQFGS